VTPTMLRTGAGIVAFIVVVIIAMLALNFGTDLVAATTWAWVGVIALAVGMAAYALMEYSQTKRFDSISGQFDTRTIVLIPLAIALNIILGQAVGTALKVPIYLDSIGTILVAVVAGPIPGALTGLLANLLWTFVVPPPFHNDYLAAFAVVAAVVGLLAGGFARIGWMRPRPTADTSRLLIGGAVTVVIVLVLAWLAYLGWQAAFGLDLGVIPEADTTLIVLGVLAVAVVLATIIGMALLLFWKRDLAVPYVVVAGLITGIVAALISAPISANVFGGVTAAGTDFLVAAFRQAGADIQAATLGQGLISDPIDKVITFAVVYLILGAMATRTKARFPQGERLLAKRDVEETAP